MSEVMATYYCHEHGEDHHWVSRNTHVDDIPWIDKCSICGLYNVERLADYAAAIRANEREQAAQRIIALCAHTKYEGCRPCSHDDAVAAVLLDNANQDGERRAAE